MELAVREATKNESDENKVDIGDIAPAAITILNAVTEKADTRNWQTLPHSIYYTRISLPEGKHKLSLNTLGERYSNNTEITIDIRENRTTFYVFQSLESFLPGE